MACEKAAIQTRRCPETETYLRARLHGYVHFLSRQANLIGSKAIDTATMPNAPASLHFADEPAVAILDHLAAGKLVRRKCLFPDCRVSVASAPSLTFPLIILAEISRRSMPELLGNLRQYVRCRSGIPSLQAPSSSQADRLFFPLPWRAFLPRDHGYWHRPAILRV